MTDRLACTDEELNQIQKAETKAFLKSLGPWADPAKTDGYWKLTDQHREEWVARVASRKKLEKIVEKSEVKEEEAA